MTHERDFDRIARAWLATGPDEAPDRAVAAVLQAIETTPQVRRPISWPIWRPIPMTRFPVLASVVAAIVVVVGGLVINRPGDPAVGGPTSSPSASAVPSVSAVGAAPVAEPLRSRWMGSERTIPGIVASAGSTILFSEARFELAQSAGSPARYLISAASSAGAGQFRLELTANGGGCTKGDIGLYTWSQSPSGRILTIAAVSDDCASRSEAVPGVWWRQGCKDTTDNCLGDLDAGTYKSQFIGPRLDPGAEWVPDFGALSYTVPEGWANNGDWPSTFGLVPSSQYALVTSDSPDVNDSIFLFTHPVAMSQETPCSGKPDAGVGRTVADEVAFLGQVPGLVTTAPTAITIDGHEGQWLDIHLDPAWTTGCGDFAPVVEYLIQARDKFGVGSPGDDRQRLILLDLGDGDLLGIQVYSSDPAGFDAFVEEAMPVVESFVFE